MGESQEEKERRGAEGECGDEQRCRDTLGCCWVTGAGLVGAQWGHFLSFGFRVQS